MSGLLRRLRNRARDLAFVPFMDRYWREQAAGRLWCLLYHAVDGPGRYPFLERFGAPTISPRALSEELSFLQDRGARFMTFADVLRGAFPGRDEFGVIVSFDDGLRSNYEAGLEVLDQLGIPGVIFQSTALIDAHQLIWEHALYWAAHTPNISRALEEMAHVRWPETLRMSLADTVCHLRENVPVIELEALLAELGHEFDLVAQQSALAAQLYPTSAHLQQARNRGHEIGAHGHRHYKRSSMNAETFADEVRTSANVLERVLGRKAAAFSYPFNDYQSGDGKICSEFFQQIATVDSAPISRDCNRLSIPRFTWPGPPRNGLRARRWLWTGRI